MLGFFAASSQFRRAPLALGLCLLAFLFAVEAKTAWYGPVVGPGSAVRAAKAWPAASPQVVKHGVRALDPSHPGIQFVAILATAAACLAGIKLARADKISNVHRPLISATYPSTNLFFRPPPVR
jgi:hypothetical protein